MLRVKVPATTSNLAVGFDTLGMSLNIYNDFTFEVSDDFQLNGFSKDQINNNLVLLSYLAFCKENNIDDEEIVKLKIDLVKQDIPIARGLGSSATCIIAGSIAANYFNKLNKSLFDIALFVSKQEGHPDNAFSAVFGGMNASFKENNTYYNENLNVSQKLNFAVLIPEVIGETEKLRASLAKTIPLEDAVYNLSRIIHLPKAIESGDFELLKMVMKDKLHQDVRKQFIPLYNKALQIANDSNVILNISGSGPSLFLISLTDDFRAFTKIADVFKLVPVNISIGTIIEVE